MYYYFSSEFPSVLKLNGIYYGTIHNQVKSCNIEGQELPFIEVCPLNGKEKPLAFIIDKDFLSRPPELISITDLGGGYMLNFKSSYYCEEFKVYAQQKYNDAVVTAFSENGYKLSIETKSDFYAESLQIELSSCEIQRVERDSRLVIAYLYGEKTLVNVYDISGKITKVFSRQVDTANFDEKLVTVESLSDMAKHKITTEWEYSDGQFRARTKKIQAINKLDKEKLNDKVVPFAFLEEFLVGGDYIEYLEGSVKENADKLGGFFGEFIGVMPPPVFRDINQVGLIYCKAKNLYSVEYFTFELKENKIVNVSKC